MRKKYSAAEKIELVEGYINGEYSWETKAHELGYKSTPGCFKRWLRVYQEQGAAGLYPSLGNNTYTKEFKQMVVEEYLDGDGSAVNLAAKYKISNADILLRWVRLYNANRELKDYYPKREVYMAEARRKTTFEERKEIVEYCLKHNRDYKGAASKYDVSYSQVYSWVKKYDADGEDGLCDRRGHHKTDDEVDELERLRRENLRLKRQLEEKDMVVELLKKVKEFEGM
jgi:transposase-like protein